MFLSIISLHILIMEMTKRSAFVVGKEITALYGRICPF